MILQRFGMADVQLRREGDGRNVTGLAVPFDQPATIDDGTGAYTEVFRRGAFTRTLAERGAHRVKLLGNHDSRRMPLGRLTSAREDPAGLVVEARVSATPDGDAALELIRDGALDSFSIGFRPVVDRWNARRDSVERVEVALVELSLVAFPAYAGAVVTAVRSKVPVDRDPSTWHARLRLPAAPSLDLDAWARRLGVTP